MIAYIKDNNYLYLDLVSTDIEDLLIKEFSVFDPKARYSIAYEDGQWDGRVVSYDRKGKKLSLTFLEDLKTLCNKEDIPLDVVDQRSEPKYKPIPKEQLNKDILPGIKLEDHQMRCLYSIYDHDNGIHAHKTGAGKCLGKGTKIILYDGSLKNVEDVKVGDLLMGDDSTPRTVLSTCSGIDRLYKVKQKNGIDYIVNEPHILSLKTTPNQKGQSSKVVDIAVTDYLNSSKRQKHILKGYKVPVSFSSKVVPFDPYFLGLWLGDGTAVDLQISVGDLDEDELFCYLNEFCEIEGMTLVQYPHYGRGCRTYAIRLYEGIYKPKNIGRHFKNHLRETFESFGLFESKHIPDIFKFNSEDVRLNLLAGFIDSDGEVKVNKDTCVIIHRQGELIDGMCYVARSLGFKVTVSTVKKRCTTSDYIGTYTSLTISGNLSRIPTKLNRKKIHSRRMNKDPLVCGINVEYIGVGEYFGFELDGNKRFLLEDFTVTHNTEMMAGIISMFPQCPTAVIAEEKIVLSQLVERLQLRAITDVGEFYAGKRPNGQLIIVGSIQALSIPPGSARKAELKRTGMDKAWQTRRKNALFLQEAIKKCHLLLVDEADRASSDSYNELFTKLAANARYRYGFSGTPFDGAKPVQNLTIRERFGNIISKSSREELEAIGRIIPVTYTMLACNEDGDKRSKTDNNSAIKEWMIENTELHNKINKICQFYKDDGTLILVESLPLGEKLAEAIPGAEFIHGKTPDNKREEVINRFESRELKVLIGSKILRRGLDLKGGCENLILCYDGQMGSEFMQRLGRAVRKNKKGSSRVFDFIIMSNHYLYKHARKRLEAVVAEGYKSTIVYKGIKISGEDIIKRRWHFPKSSARA